MPADEARTKLTEVPGWQLQDGTKISRTFELGTFAAAIAFINQIAEIAEDEDHHPDLCNYYDKVVVSLMTHKINGLHENDFIMAAKINRLTSK